MNNCKDKKDMSKNCKFNYEDMYIKRNNKEITDNEFQQWFNKNCARCVHMCEICMYGEE